MPGLNRKRKNAPYTEVFKHKVLSYYLSINRNATKTCKIMSIPRSTLYFWINTYSGFIEKEKARLQIPPGSMQGMLSELLKFPPSEAKDAALGGLLNVYLERLCKVASMETDVYKLSIALTSISNTILAEQQLSKRHAAPHLKRVSNETEKFV